MEIRRAPVDNDPATLQGFDKAVTSAIYTIIYRDDCSISKLFNWCSSISEAINGIDKSLAEKTSKQDLNIQKPNLGNDDRHI